MLTMSANGVHESDNKTEIRVNGTPPAEGPDADVVIVGGGPAGLSAALILARANRKVLIFDAGDKRNEKSQTQHAILGADGEHRPSFIQRAREQVLRYPTVEFHEVSIVDINIDAARTKPSKDSKLKSQEKVVKTWQFEVVDSSGKIWRAKKCILATGVRDKIPEVEGFEEYWARGIWVCLYCDGYEYNGKTLGAFGNDERGVHLALEMLLWSPHVTLFTHGEPLMATARERALLKEKHIEVVEEPITRAYGNGDHLEGVELESGRRISLDSLFFNTGRFQSSTLPTKMGLRSDDRGDLVCEARGNVESVDGLYAAGNCATAPLKLVMTAASQGAVTGAKINSELMYAELGLNDDPGPAYVEGSQATKDAEV